MHFGSFTSERINSYTSILKNRIFTWTVISLLITSCVPLGTLPTQTTTSKTLVYDNQNYERYVGNVILNSFNPFIELGSVEPLHLEFDLLTNKFENLRARIIHCNFDWTPSRLIEMDYLDGFNRFDHTSFEYSTNTKTPYIQYFFELNRPKISGNYLVVLFRRGNESDILFSRRLVFYEKQISINAELRIPTKVADRRTDQQLDFSINYGGIQAPNPRQNFRTIIFQNKDWDRAIVDLEPTGMNASANSLEWRYFGGETNFHGWNQFRWLDIRTLNLRGIGVAQIERLSSEVKVTQSLESAHGRGSYRQLINDNNGRYIPGNSDPGESWLEADYAKVQFALKSDEYLGDVYVMGRFNDWKKLGENKMRYDSENKVYFTNIRLKQGYYDYRYELESDDLPAYEFEGSHFQAENEYDILVYYRAPGKINDQVVGYLSLNSEGFY